MSKSTYNTAARRMLTEYLSSRPDRQLTAAEIYQGLLKLGEKYDEELPGISTVYRLLNSLYSEGVLKRFYAAASECSPDCPQCSHTHNGTFCEPPLITEGKNGQNKSRAGLYVYQYVGNLDCNGHFHLKCLHCGTVIHLNRDTGIDLIRNVEKTNGFRIKCGASILYGICAECENSIELSAKAKPTDTSEPNPTDTSAAKRKMKGIQQNDGNI